MNYPAETDIRTTAQALQNHAKEKVVQVQEIVQERAAQAQEQAVKAAHQVEDYVRKNPLNALCLAAGLGLAAVVLVRALTPPPPPRNRAVQLLEDIQQRLYELAQPAYERGAGLLDEGAHAVSKTVDGLHLDRTYDKVSRGLRSLFH